MTSAGDLQVSVTADTSRLMGQVAKQSQTVGQKAGSTFRTAFTGVFAGLGAVAAVQGTIRAIGAAFTEAATLQTLGAQTAAVIKSTGGAANVSAGQIREHAAALESLSAIDEYAIQRGQNLLLTFRNIRNEAGAGNDIFDQTTVAMVNLSAAMGKDPQSAALMLGKALNNPVKGMTALTRAGVQFSDRQTKMITRLVESGRTMDAQKIILKELKVEFGGAGKAAGSGFAGAMFRAKDAVADLLRDMATGLLPVLTKVANWVAKKMIPAVQRFAARIGPQLTPIVKQLGRFLASLLPPLRAFGGFLLANASTLTKMAVAVGVAYAAWRTYQGVVGAVSAAERTYKAVKQSLVLWTYTEQAATLRGTAAKVKDIAVMAAHKAATLAMAAASKVWAAAQWLLNVALNANPISLIITAIAGLIAIVVVAYKRSETFRAIVQAVWSAIKTAVGAAVRYVTDVIKKGWALVSTIFRVYVTAWKAVITAAWRIIQAVVRAGVDYVMRVIRGLQAVWGFVRDVFGRVVTAVRDAIDRAVDVVRGLKDRVIAFFGGAGRWLVDAGKNIIQGLLDGLDAALDWVRDKLSGIASMIPDWLKHVLGIASPSKVTEKIGAQVAEGLAVGIAGGTRSVQDATDGLLGGVRSPRLAAMPGARRMTFDPASIIGGDSPTEVRVFIGERELTDIVRVETRRETAKAGAAYRYRRN